MARRAKGGPVLGAPLKRASFGTAYVIGFLSLRACGKTPETGFHHCPPKT